MRAKALQSQARTLVSRDPNGWKLGALGACGALLALACDTPVSNPEPRLDSPSSLVSETTELLDDEFERLSGLSPGFAGWYLGTDGAPVVLMVGPELPASITPVLLSSMQQRRLSPGKIAQAKFVKASYTFGELRQWYRTLLPQLDQDVKVTAIDIDEVNNRIVVGSLDPTQTRMRLAPHAKAARVPESALTVQYEEEVRVSVNINQNVGGPPPGGVAMAAVHLGGACTMGINASYSGLPGFITNSHCTINWGGVASVTQFRQGTVSDSVVGLEHADPFYQTCKFNQWVCRYSDAAFIKYKAGSSGDFPKIAKTNFYGWYPPDGQTGSITIDPSSPTFTIIGNQASLVVGMYLQRVGVMTGWVAGPVNQTCTDRSQGSGKWLWCQGRMNGLAIGGDSGGPVFTRVLCPGESPPLAGTCAYFAGLHWGISPGQMYFSPVNNIIIDFGNVFSFF